MIYGVLKALVSGLIVALVSETARRNAAMGALLASLPVVSILGMMWLWRDTHDTARLADHAQATFWYVIPSLPMFLVIPALLRRGVGFWPAMGLGCVVTIILYGITVWTVARFGVRL